MQIIRKMHTIRKFILENYTLKGSLKSLCLEFREKIKEFSRNFFHKSRHPVTGVLTFTFVFALYFVRYSWSRVYNVAYYYNWDIIHAHFAWRRKSPRRRYIVKGRNRRAIGVDCHRRLKIARAENENYVSMNWTARVVSERERVSSSRGVASRRRQRPASRRLRLSRRRSFISQRERSSYRTDYISISRCVFRSSLSSGRN